MTIHRLHPDGRAAFVAVLRAELPGRLARREPLSREERTFAVYGLLAAVATALALVLAVAFWQAQVSLVVADVLRHDGAWPLLALLAVLGGSHALRGRGSGPREGTGSSI